MNEKKLLEEQICQIFALKERANQAKTKADACRVQTSGMGLSHGSATENLVIRPYHSSILLHLTEEYQHMEESFAAYSEAITIEKSIIEKIQIFELKEFFIELQQRELLHGLSFQEYDYGYALRCSEFGSFVWLYGSAGRNEGLIEHFGVFSEFDSAIFSVGELKTLISRDLDLD